MITAENITDDQIRAVRAWLELALLDTGMALLDKPITETLAATRRQARARCASIVNFWSTK